MKLNQKLDYSAKHKLKFHILLQNRKKCQKVIKSAVIEIEIVSVQTVMFLQKEGRGARNIKGGALFSVLKR